MARSVKRFSIAKGADENTADPDTQGVGFRLLKNCAVDRRIGALLPRRGSLTETLTTGLGVPLGMGEHLAEASTSLIPVTRSLLVNFGGSAFWKFQTGAWSSVTVDGNTSFDSAKANTFDQIGENLYIAGGRPAVWKGGSNDVDRVGIPAPTTAPTLGSSLTGLTGTFKYVYTFRDSTTGLESDRSPEAEITVTDDQIDISALETVVAASGVDEKRIYRTQNGGVLFFLVGTVPIATTTFTDTVDDVDLGIPAPASGDNALPPDSSFIVATFNQRVWWVDADDPYVIHFSKPYIGNNNDTQYFPTTNFLVADEPVTALHVTPNRMLVFHPRNISFISGFSTSDFVFAPLRQGIGTLFSTGVATNGDEVVIVSEQGIVAQSGKGMRHISRPLEPTITELLGNEYNSSLYASVTWSPSLRQFLFLISAESTSGAPWITVGTGALADWGDATTGTTEEWEDPAAPGSQVTTRVFFAGWSPETDQWTVYEYEQVQDLNSDNAYAVFLFTPLPSSDTLDPQQDKTYCGIFDGTEGIVVSQHRRDMIQDDTTDVTAEFLTERLIVGADDNGVKRIHSLGFTTSYSDPSEIGTIDYVKDLEDPHIRGFTSDLKTFSGSGDLKRLTEQKMRFMHLHGLFTGVALDQPILTDFALHFRERFSREQR
jgi:hypothetical protein